MGCNATPQPTGTCWSVLALLVLAIVPPMVLAAGSCDSGIIQMKPFSSNDSCFWAPLTTNSIKAICGFALRVRVKDGVVKIVPLQLGTYKYHILAEHMGQYEYPFDCKQFNASGLLYPGSTTSASVMLYDDYGGPLSNLTKTGAGQISLIPAHTYTYQGPDPPGPPLSCIYNYTVIEGCVFGIKAPAKPAAACPAGYSKVTGRFKKSFCAPCPPGLYTSKAGATTCDPCPPGTENPQFGATGCTDCLPPTYADKAGAASCDYCSPDTNYVIGGIRCLKCPAGSYTATNNKPQCVKCNAGKKCCTVGADKGCPQCTDGSAGGSYTSIFALESTTPSSCLATGHALCSPKLNITVDGTCTVTLNNLDNSNNPDDNTYCSWSTTVPIQGVKFSISDIAKFDAGLFSNGSLLAGNFTSASSPYLNIYIPDTKCTLRYRALTAPVATLLGAAPKPGKATSCPAGQYLETKTDTKPGPCLPCPLGTYSPTPSSGRACLRCKAGTYTNRYGSTKCKNCPSGLVAKPGSSYCSLCDSNSVPAAGGKSCVLCPANSATPAYGSSPQCLRQAYGTICCAAGDCKGQNPCSSSSPPPSDFGQSYIAVFQILSKNAAQPACKNATFLSCLPPNGKVQLTAYSSAVSLQMGVYRTKLNCANYSTSFTGGYTGTKSAYLYEFVPTVNDSVAYGLVSDSSKGTVTVYLAQYISNINFVSQVPIKATADCSITLKLLSGYAFDLTPPKVAACDPLDSVTTYQGRQFCFACQAGQFKNSTGMCQDCPSGYYNMQSGSGTCKPCLAGYSCFSGTGTPNPCLPGYYSKPKQDLCTECPANTFGSAIGLPTAKCTPCPKGTIAPTIATACGVPWDKAFPA